MTGFDQALRHLKDHRGEGVTIRLPFWKPDVGIKLTAAHDGPDTRAMGQPTHDYLTASSRYGYVPWIPTQVELLSDDWQLCDTEGRPVE